MARLTPNARGFVRVKMLRDLHFSPYGADVHAVAGEEYECRPAIAQQVIESGDAVAVPMRELASQDRPATAAVEWLKAGRHTLDRCNPVDAKVGDISVCTYDVAVQHVQQGTAKLVDPQLAAPTDGAAEAPQDDSADAAGTWLEKSVTDAKDAAAHLAAVKKQLDEKEIGAHFVPAGDMDVDGLPPDMDVPALPDARYYHAAQVKTIYRRDTADLAAGLRNGAFVARVTKDAFVMIPSKAALKKAQAALA